MLLAEDWKHEDCMVHVHVQVCHLFSGREAFVVMNKLPVYLFLIFSGQLLEMRVILPEWNIKSTPIT